MSFGEVVQSAIRFAAEGFPVHPTMAEFVGKHVADYARFPQNAEFFYWAAARSRSARCSSKRSLRKRCSIWRTRRTRRPRRDARPGSRPRVQPSTMETSRRRLRNITNATVDGSRADLAGYQVTFEPSVRTRTRGSTSLPADHGAKARCSGKSWQSSTVSIWRAWATTVRAIFIF